MKHSPELQLIVNALKPRQDKLDLDPALNWALLYKLIIRHRVWHQLLAALTPVNEIIPSPIYSRLVDYCKKDKLRILAKAAETVRLAREFDKTMIHHCFIKGIVLNNQIYNKIDTRPCKDIDVWVSVDDLQRASDLLLSLGYQISFPKYELKGFHRRYHLSHKHDIAFYHSKRKIQVELHFKLSYLGIDFFPPTTAMMKQIDLFNTPITTLADDYHLLFLIIHGAIHAWSRLRWLNDIALYIKSGHCNLQQVRELSIEIGCEHLVDQTLLLVQTLLGADDPALSQLVQNPSSRGIKLAQLAKVFVFADYEMTPDYSICHKMFFKYRFYLVQIATKGQKLKAMMDDLFKIDMLFDVVKQIKTHQLSSFL